MEPRSSASGDCASVRIMQTRPSALLQDRGPCPSVANQALRLGRTIRRVDLFQYEESGCPSRVFGNPHLHPSSSRDPPPPTYAAVLRRSSSPPMAGRNGSQPKGAPPLGQDAPSPGVVAGFGVQAGPLRFGVPHASSSTTPPTVQQVAAPTPAPVVFGAPSNQPAPDAPPARRPRNKRKGGRRDAGAVTTAARSLPPPAVVAVPAAQIQDTRDINSVALATVDTTGQMPKGKRTGLWCFKCRSDDHLSKDCTVVHYCHICNNHKHPMHRCHVLKQPRPCALLGG